MENVFEVVYPGNVLQEFRELCRDAKWQGMFEEVAAAAELIHTGLREDPRSFGDPSYTIAATRQDVFVRGVPPLITYYAVHQIKNLVIVKSIKWFRAELPD